MISCESGSYQRAVKAWQSSGNALKMDFFGGLGGVNVLSKGEGRPMLTVFIGRNENLVRTIELTIPCLKSPLINDDFRKVLEYQSGRNPLLLRGILKRWPISALPTYRLKGSHYIGQS